MIQVEALDLKVAAQFSPSKVAQVLLTYIWEVLISNLQYAYELRVVTQAGRKPGLYK
jgi:hypothetical protein